MSLNRRAFLAAGAALTTSVASSASSAMASNANGAIPASDASAGSAGEEGHGGVRTDAEILAAQGWRPFAGRKVGVLSNPTGVLANGDHIVDSMVAAGIRPAAAFGPEHGFRGSAQTGGSEGDYTDPRTGVPVYDAYGVDAVKLAAMITKAGVDIVVFDIADVGARFYTYGSCTPRWSPPRRPERPLWSWTGRTRWAARLTARC